MSFWSLKANTRVVDPKKSTRIQIKRLQMFRKDKHQTPPQWTVNSTMQCGQILLFVNFLHLWDLPTLYVLAKRFINTQAGVQWTVIYIIPSSIRCIFDLDSNSWYPENGSSSRHCLPTPTLLERGLQKVDLRTMCRCSDWYFGYN